MTMGELANLMREHHKCIDAEYRVAYAASMEVT